MMAVVDATRRRRWSRRARELHHPFLGVVAAAWLASCATAGGGAAPESKAAGAITPLVLAPPIRFLADDLLEGRAPGGRGEAIARLYIATQMEALGLEPGARDGAWEQPVPLLGVTSRLGTMVGVGSRSTVRWTPRDDFVLFRFGAAREQVDLRDVEVVFAGYGITAPEQGWDDYKGADVRGKMVLLLYNDPDWDVNLFSGKSRVYYGTPLYKATEAAGRGAAGVILLHTRESAGWPWQVAQTSSGGEQSRLTVASGPELETCVMATEDAVGRLVAAGGYELGALSAAARSREFAPQPLGVAVSVRIDNQLRPYESANVVGVVRGSDPDLRDEFVVYTAHHDHLGERPDKAGRPAIFNGAVDNASGVAQLLAVARAYQALPQRPRRSILFVTVTAEEQGLLGSEYFTLHPTVPAASLVAAINFDGGNVWGSTRDVAFAGGHRSSLDELAGALARREGRSVVEEAMPQDGVFYRSDQFSFARIGVPVLFVRPGYDIVDRPAGWGKEQRQDYIARRYHQPGDDFDPSWDLTGMAQDARLAFAVGLAAADADERPSWQPGDEFEAAARARTQPVPQ